MKVFISWSGEQSHRVALALRGWLPAVLQNVDTWVSSEDIDKGAVWIDRLGAALADADFGIVCLVPGNVNASWINFEAGVMAREIETASVSSLLVGLGHSDVQGGPLALFQNTIVEKDDVRKLVHSINRASLCPIPDDRLNAAFDMGWPTLAQQLGALAQASDASVDPTPAAARPQDDLSEKQVAVLVFLAQHDGQRISIDDIARSIEELRATAQYYVDELRQRAFIYPPVISRRGPRYQISHDGRKYLFERDLI